MRSTAVELTAREAMGRLFADNLRAHLTRLGWTGPQLAREAGMPVDTVTAYLRESRCPRIDAAHRIALVLDTTIDELCDPNGAHLEETR